MKISKIREIIKLEFLLKGALVGGVVGVVVAVFRLLTTEAAKLTLPLYTFLKQDIVMVELWVIVIFLVGFVISRWIDKYPMAKGGGLAQVEEQLKKRSAETQLKTIVIRTISGIVGSLFGVALGRAGPSVHLGASSAELIAKQMKSSEEETSFVITAGASAGLAATFSSPISGFVFIYEKVHKKLILESICFVATAVIVADAISNRIFGLTPILYFVEVKPLSMHLIGWLIVLGILAGCVGVLIKKTLDAVNHLAQKCTGAIQPIIVLLIALLVGLFVPRLLGSGQNLIELAETTRMSLVILMVAFIIKLGFTALSSASGFPGGVIMPILALGALLGSAVGQQLSGVGVPSTMVAIFCICSMAGVLASALGIPLTSIFLLIEMTGSLTHIVPIVVTTLIATQTTKMIQSVIDKKGK